MPMPPDQDQTEVFLEYQSASSRDVFYSILALVIDVDIAEDIYQEVNLVMWRKFNTFEKGTDFRAWALKIALYQVMAWRKRVSRNRLVFNEDFMTLIAEEFEKDHGTKQDQKAALDDCVKSLSQRHQQLIAYRYEMSLSPRDIAAKTGKTIDGIRRTLSRVRKILQECTDRKLREI